MKANFIVNLVCFIAVFCSLACGPSDEQVKKVIKVGTEIAAIQKDYYPAITELGRVAGQVESVSQRQDPSTNAMASEITKARQFITDAFTACQKAQDSAVVGSMYTSAEKYILAEEQFKALLKEALEKTNAAVNKSHEVLEALANAKTGKQARKR